MGMFADGGTFAGAGTFANGGIFQRWGAACPPLLVRGLVALLAGGLPASELAAHETSGIEIATPPSAAAGLPQVLSAQDAARYQLIFALQKKGKWWAADRRIEGLENRLLTGHVLAQRYLHPTHYRSKFSELKAWMAKYAEHRDARRIYRLAMRRKPAGAKPPRRPVTGYFRSGAEEYAAPAPYRSKKRLNRGQRRRVAILRSSIGGHVKAGRLTTAEHLLAHKEIRKLFDDVEFDAAKSAIAGAYFHRGRDRKAFALASESAARSGRHLPSAHWTAGLAAWRLRMFAEAAAHFEAVARARNLSPWNLAAGAYWAARAHLLNRRPQNVNRWMNVAAEHPRTFYGLLARHSLGLETEFNWDDPALDQRDLDALARTPTGKRALALIQVGEVRRAERDLVNFPTVASPAVMRALLALASLINMPGLALSVGNRLTRAGGQRYDSAIYPAPSWRPKEGYTFDRALVFALMRQESRFNTRAKSPAGAHGLMQIMPQTARFMTNGRRFRGRARYELYEPELNISLGQKYLAHLVGDEAILGNLILLTAAYNGGPGNLAKWRRRVAHNGDPLLFIESIPSRETRVFIERVIANLWIYRKRLDQPAPSLDAVAAGEWPVYVALDGADSSMAEHARD